MPDNNLKETILQILQTYDEVILKNAPNLSPEDCWFLIYSVIGYQLGKNKYFGLTFHLEDSAQINELSRLSNGYVEIRDKVVKMGVIELENLEKILRAPYITPKSVHIY